MGQQAKLDPITTEIIRSSLNSAAEEMNATLIRSAYTPVIYEMKDCSVGLLDENHLILGQSSGLPIFLGNLEVVTQYTEQTYGREVWKPGDIWVLNDSYIGGTHLHDMTVYGPVFSGRSGRSGFATCRAHWLDVGGKNAGSSTDSTDIFQEGLRVGGIRVVEAGEMRLDVVDLLSRNSRFSYPARGDLFAQIACVTTGQQRLEAIVDKFGLDVIRAARDELPADRALRAASRGSHPRRRLSGRGVHRRRRHRRHPEVGAAHRDRVGRGDDDRPERQRRHRHRARELRGLSGGSRSRASPSSFSDLPGQSRGRAARSAPCTSSSGKVRCWPRRSQLLSNGTSRRSVS